MTFTAAGLPRGLSIDAATGRISGTVAAAGQSIVTVAAQNGAGRDEAPLTFVVGSTLGLTPPMGWNSYDSYGDSVTESEVISQAQAMLQHLQPFGWHYVVVDYRWYDPKDGTPLAMDANGRLLPAANRFPSATGSLGFKPLADRIHAMGLEFGIHIMRGIPRQAVPNSPIYGSTYVARDAANTADICPWNSDMWGASRNAGADQAWYDSIFQQYADWGIDFVKVDDMLNNQVRPNLYHQFEVDEVRKAIDKAVAGTAGTPSAGIVLSLSPGQMPVSSASDLTSNANMWRMADDFWDRPPALNLMFTLGYNWQGVDAPGHWPDADMLPLGALGPRCPIDGTNRATRFTPNEQVTTMSFWAILPSPLFLGADMTRLDAWTTALLTNEEVLSIDQDALGHRARRVAAVGATEVWARELSGGKKAVGLFNHDGVDQLVSVTWNELGMVGQSTARDVWKRSDITVPAAGPSLNVPYRGAVLLLITPLDGIDAGAVNPIDAAPSDATSAAEATTTVGATPSEGGGTPDVVATSEGGDGGVSVGGSGEGSVSAGMPGGSGSGATAGSAASESARGSPSSCTCQSVGRSGTVPLGTLRWFALAAALVQCRIRRAARSNRRPRQSTAR